MFLQSYITPLYKDNNLLTLKVSLDNAVLEMKAKENNLTEIP